MSERQFLFFCSFPWPGKPLELASFQVLLPKVATRSVCSFCSPVFSDRCGGRHPSSACLFLSAGCQPLPFLCSVLSQPRAVCGLDWASVIRHKGFKPLPTQKSVYGSYLTHTTNIPGVASASSGGSVLEGVGTTEL